MTRLNNSPQTAIGYGVDESEIIYPFKDGTAYVYKKFQYCPRKHAIVNFSGHTDTVAPVSYNNAGIAFVELVRLRGSVNTLQDVAGTIYIDLT